VFDEVRGHQAASVTVVVEGVPDDPDAVDDEFAVEPGSQGVFLEVLANDENVDYPAQLPWSNILYYNMAAIDIDVAVTTMPIVTINLSDDVMASSYLSPIRPDFMDKGLTITSVGTGDQGGIVEISTDGRSLVYTPADGFEGIETFTYTIATEAGLTDTATVTVRVGEMSEPIIPVIYENPTESPSLPASEESLPPEVAALVQLGPEKVEEPSEADSQAAPTFAPLIQDGRGDRTTSGHRFHAASRFAKERAFSTSGWDQWNLLLAELGASRGERPADRAFADLFQCNDELEDMPLETGGLGRSVLPRAMQNRF
jgi:hypothetical protein